MNDGDSDQSTIFNGVYCFRQPISYTVKCCEKKGGKCIQDGNKSIPPNNCLSALSLSHCALSQELGSPIWVTVLLGSACPTGELVTVPPLPLCPIISKNLSRENNIE